MTARKSHLEKMLHSQLTGIFIFEYQTFCRTGRFRHFEFMAGIIITDPQFVYRKNMQTGEAVIYCTRPVSFKAYVFFTNSKPFGFRLLPEKDTEQIRKIMRRMNDWFMKWHAMEEAVNAT